MRCVIEQSQSYSMARHLRTSKTCRGAGSAAVLAEKNHRSFYSAWESYG